MRNRHDVLMTPVFVQQLLHYIPMPHSSLLVAALAQLLREKPARGLRVGRTAIWKLSFEMLKLGQTVQLYYLFDRKTVMLLSLKVL